MPSVAIGGPGPKPTRGSLRGASNARGRHVTNSRGGAGTPSRASSTARGRNQQSHLRATRGGGPASTPQNRGSHRAQNNLRSHGGGKQNGASWQERYEALTKDRERERADAIRQGLIADPDKPRLLSEAVTIVGTCQDMCAEYERVQRVVQQDVWPEETDPDESTSGSNEAEPNESRMVKKFRRAAAGLEEQLPSDLRPAHVLKKTCDYLFDDVIENASDLAKVHHFVWDRTRAIRNDFSIQQFNKPEDLAIAIECYERIARFHIISLHLLALPEKPYSKYDGQQEREQLDRTLLSLIQYYDDCRGRIELKNEAEFRAYCVIFQLQDPTPDLEDRIQSWPASIIQHPRVQRAIELYTAACNIHDPQGPLKPRTAHLIARQDWRRFWVLTASTKVSYTMACVAEIYFNLVRRTVLNALFRTFRMQNNLSTPEWTIDTLRELFAFDREDDVYWYCGLFGFTFGENEHGQHFLDLASVKGKNLPEPTAGSLKQSKSKLVENKRHGRTTLAVINGFSVREAQDFGLIEDVDNDGSSQSVAENDDEVDDDDQDPTDSSTLFIPQSNKSQSHPFSASFGSDTKMNQPFGAKSFSFGKPSHVGDVASMAKHDTVSQAKSLPSGFNTSSGSQFVGFTATQPNPEPKSTSLFNFTSTAATNPANDRPNGPFLSALPKQGETSGSSPFSSHKATAMPSLSKSSTIPSPDSTSKASPFSFTPQPSSADINQKPTSQNSLSAATQPRAGTSFSPLNADETSGFPSFKPNSTVEDSLSIGLPSMKDSSPTALTLTTNQLFPIGPPPPTSMDTSTFHQTKSEPIQFGAGYNFASPVNNIPKFSGFGFTNISPEPPKRDEAAKTSEQAISSTVITSSFPSNAVPSSPNFGTEPKRSSISSDTRPKKPSPLANSFTLNDDTNRHGTSTSSNKADRTHLVEASLQNQERDTTTALHESESIGTTLNQERVEEDFEMTITRLARELLNDPVTGYLKQYVEYAVGETITAVQAKITQERDIALADGFRKHTLATKYGKVWARGFWRRRLATSGKQRRQRRCQQLEIRSINEASQGPHRAINNTKSSPTSGISQLGRSRREQVDAMFRLTPAVEGRGSYSQITKTRRPSSSHARHAPSSSIQEGIGHKRLKSARHIGHEGNFPKVPKVTATTASNTNLLERSSFLGFSQSVGKRSPKNTTSTNYFRLKALGLTSRESRGTKRPFSEYAQSSPRRSSIASNSHSVLSASHTLDEALPTSSIAPSAEDEVESILARSKALRERLGMGRALLSSDNTKDNLCRSTASQSSYESPTMAQARAATRLRAPSLNPCNDADIYAASVPAYRFRESKFVPREHYERAIRQAMKMRESMSRESSRPQSKAGNRSDQGRPHPQSSSSHTGHSMHTHIFNAHEHPAHHVQDLSPSLLPSELRGNSSNRLRLAVNAKDGRDQTIPRSMIDSSLSQSFRTSVERTIAHNEVDTMFNGMPGTDRDPRNVTFSNPSTTLMDQQDRPESDERDQWQDEHVSIGSVRNHDDTDEGDGDVYADDEQLDSDDADGFGSDAEEKDEAPNWHGQGFDSVLNTRLRSTSALRDDGTNGVGSSAEEAIELSD